MLKSTGIGGTYDMRTIHIVHWWRISGYPQDNSSCAGKGPWGENRGDLSDKSGAYLSVGGERGRSLGSKVGMAEIWNSKKQQSTFSLFLFYKSSIKLLSRFLWKWEIKKKKIEKWVLFYAWSPDKSGFVWIVALLVTDKNVFLTGYSHIQDIISCQTTPQNERESYRPVSDADVFYYRTLCTVQHFCDSHARMNRFCDRLLPFWR